MAFQVSIICRNKEKGRKNCSVWENICWKNLKSCLRTITTTITITFIAMKCRQRQDAQSSLRYNKVKGNCGLRWNQMLARVHE